MQHFHRTGNTHMPGVTVALWNAVIPTKATRGSTRGADREVKTCLSLAHAICLREGLQFDYAYSTSRA